MPFFLSPYGMFVWFLYKKEMGRILIIQALKSYVEQCENIGLY